MALRLVGEYIWLWLALVASLVLYVLLALWNRGNITISSTRWWEFSIHRRANRPASAVYNMNDQELAERKLAYDLLACVALLVMDLLILMFAQVSPDLCHSCAPIDYRPLDDVR
jgi:hypothetical protein